MVKINEIEYKPIKDAIYGIVGFRRADTGEEIETDDPRFKELLQKHQEETGEKS